MPRFFRRVVTQPVDGLERRLELSPFELKLLICFFENCDRVMSREQRLQAVYSFELSLKASEE
jgi:DNA-binding response OmpR family regulator